MNFYEHQEAARRKTFLLTTYFTLAVVIIVITINMVAFLALKMASFDGLSFDKWLGSWLSWATAVGTLAAIAGGSLTRMHQLSKGGGISVALMAGATPLVSNTQDPRERILLNVVEEMAIASGCSVPKVFVMRNETAINAFVAGTEPRNTVLAITQGALTRLNRDELQGVVGHEFSHILNGDMKLNIRILGTLAGILVIGQLGFKILRGERGSHWNPRGSSNSLYAFPFALALIAVGYVGLFFGRLIKAAISRQREFLADASSVQFTRNPEGIASALYAIKHYAEHGLIHNLHAEDLSHMYFGESVALKFNRLLATHPPIETRIEAIKPGLVPRLKARFRNRDTKQVGAQPSPNNEQSPFTMQFTHNSSRFETTKVNPSSIKASVGTPTPQHYGYAKTLLNMLPQSLRVDAHDDGAESLIYALLLTKNSQPRLALASMTQSNARKTQIEEQLQQLQTCNERFHLPLLDMALATLTMEKVSLKRKIIDNCATLVRADNQLSLSEFVYSYLITTTLANTTTVKETINSLADASKELAQIFCLLVISSGEPKETRRQNFKIMMAGFFGQDYSHLLDQPPTYKELTAALQKLGRLNPLLKQPVVDACVDCILMDGKVKVKEVEVLRALSDALGCPIPPAIDQTNIK